MWGPPPASQGRMTSINPTTPVHGPNFPLAGTLRPCGSSAVEIAESFA